HNAALFNHHPHRKSLMEKHPDANVTLSSVETVNTHQWTAQDSADLYGIREWGAGYFDVSEQGDAVVTVNFADNHSVNVPLIDITNGMKERGLAMPAVLRIENLLDHRIQQLNEAFA